MIWTFVGIVLLIMFILYEIFKYEERLMLYVSKFEVLKNELFGISFEVNQETIFSINFCFFLLILVISVFLEVYFNFDINQIKDIGTFLALILCVEMGINLAYSSNQLEEIIELPINKYISTRNINIQINDILMSVICWFLAYILQSYFNDFGVMFISWTFWFQFLVLKKLLFRTMLLNKTNLQAINNLVFLTENDIIDYQGKLSNTTLAIIIRHLLFKTKIIEINNDYKIEPKKKIELTDFLRQKKSNQIKQIGLLLFIIDSILLASFPLIYLLYSLNNFIFFMRFIGVLLLFNCLILLFLFFHEQNYKFIEKIIKMYKKTYLYFYDENKQVYLASPYGGIDRKFSEFMKCVHSLCILYELYVVHCDESEVEKNTEKFLKVFLEINSKKCGLEKIDECNAIVYLVISFINAKLTDTQMVNLQKYVYFRFDKWEEYIGKYEALCSGFNDYYKDITSDIYFKNFYQYENGGI